MPETDQVTPSEGRRAGVVSGFGIAAAVLAVAAVAAAVVIAVMWSGHRAAASERGYQARSMQAAAEWTGVLINMNTDNVEGSLATLRDGTVGELNSGFDASIAPYREVVKTLRYPRNIELHRRVTLEIEKGSDPSRERRLAVRSDELAE